MLVIAQLAPPSLLTAARRSAGLVKYLDRLGYQVTLVTSLLSGAGRGVPGAQRTIRTRDLMVSGLNWRRGSFKSMESEGSGDYSAQPSPLASWVVPDLGLLSWAPFALTRALGLARSTDCVITTAPPYSVHLIGLALKRLHGVPWIADFRDGWRFEGNRPAFELPGADALDGTLERTVAHSADRVIAVTEPIACDLSRRFEIDAQTITNGFDPEERVEPDDLGLLRADRTSLLYTGTLGYSGISPQPLLEGLRRLRRDDPRRATEIELVFAGPLSAQERAWIEAPDLDGAARAVGMLDRDKVLALQRAADALIVITHGQSGLATGKLYEYLAARRPILVLGQETAAGRIVDRAGAGLAVDAADPASIASGLARLPGMSPEAREDMLGHYSYAGLAERLAEQIEIARATH